MDQLHYDRETGEFRWSISKRGASKGSLAGSLTGEGYWQIKLDRKVHRAHRLAWFIVFGAWPDGEIDHINGDRRDNRISNLRVVDRSGNSQNRRNAMSNNKSCGLLGVTWNKQHKKWQSKITANKVCTHVGYFTDPQLAHEAYLKAKSALHIHGGCH